MHDCYGGETAEIQMPVRRGIKHGCLASGSASATLFGPMVRMMAEGCGEFLRCSLCSPTMLGSLCMSWRGASGQF